MNGWVETPVGNMIYENGFLKILVFFFFVRRYTESKGVARRWLGYPFFIFVFLNKLFGVV